MFGLGVPTAEKRTFSTTTFAWGEASEGFEGVTLAQLLPVQLSAIALCISLQSLAHHIHNPFDGQISSLEPLN
jgi:hypothetical protein